MPRQNRATIGNENEVESESEQITSIMNLLQYGMRNYLKDAPPDFFRIIRTVTKALDNLRSQVSEGYHRNPPKSFHIVGKMGDDVHSVRYRHAKDGVQYKHDFEQGSAKLYAIERNGKRDLLITGAVPLWDNFD